MNSEDPIGIVELGNLNLKCSVFKVEEDTVEVMSTSVAPSDGIHNDIIINLSRATNAIRSCISDAEKKAKISLKKINLVFEQPDFLCTRFSKHKKIDRSQIHKDDIEFLLKEAKKQLILNDNRQSIIHIFNHNYVVDGKIFVQEPIGVYADMLTHEITFITTLKNNIKNVNQAFVDCDIEIERLISRTFSLGVKLLNHEEMETGSSIIDLGFERISFGVFKNLALIHSITIPFGINHITKDISKVCSLTLEESEKIKNFIDFSFQNNQEIFDENKYLKNSFFISSKYRKISQNLVLDVVRARLDEIFNSLKKQLILAGFNLNSGIKILLTGGGSNLSNIDKCFSNFFGPNVSRSYNNAPTDKNLENNFDACFGALKIIKDGWETEAIPKRNSKNIEKIGFFAKIFNFNK
tara:strand:+ start:545 stop:1771 length:1227 start_codon:yes stop_codon:yes gene_type:complete